MQASTNALVALDDEAVEHTAQLLGEDAPQVVDGSTALPDSGAILLALPLAKGLEFDHVVVVDASSQAFPENDLSRRRLYTAISRATSTVTVLSNGPLSSLLR